MLSSKPDEFLAEQAVHIRRVGWARFNLAHEGETRLQAVTLAIASAFGSPMPGRFGELVERLLPTGTEEAPRRSLSAKYGLDELPFHVDTAHWPTPGRYVVLSCVNPGAVDVPTLLLDRRNINFSTRELNLIRTEVFYVRNGSKSFYASILESDEKFIRVDPGCMEPQTNGAFDALMMFSAERISQHASRIVWRSGDIVVVDNWRVLHARTPVRNAESGRLLLRCISR